MSKFLALLDGKFKAHIVWPVSNDVERRERKNYGATLDAVWPDEPEERSDSWLSRLCDVLVHAERAKWNEIHGGDEEE